MALGHAIRRVFSRLGAALVLATALLFAQQHAAFAAGGVTGTLRGTVVEAQTGNPVAGASVTASSGSGTFRTVTDGHGFFTFLQIPTDTYVLSIEKQSYVAYSVSGVTVLGDQIQSVGIIRLNPALRTIGNVHTTARAASAFQPNQTIDETTFVGPRIQQALGEKGSTDFNKLVESAPGVIQTAVGGCTAPPSGIGCLGAFSIRGSASVEIGYQFDGVDYRGSFFDENPNQGLLNGVGPGHGSVQVVSGAGDATQGGIGAGVVNIVPGRGSYPGDGFVSFDIGGPWYDHSFAGEYGIASPNGRFSEFFSVRSARVAPQIAPYGRDAADARAYLGTSFTYDDDVLNNFYYRFGKNQDQQLQVLVDYLDHRSWTNYGGLQGANFYPYDPFSYTQFQTDGAGFPMWGCLHPQVCIDDPSQVASQQLAWYQSIIPYAAHVPLTQSPVHQPEQFIYGPTNFLKIGYTRNLSAHTDLNAFFYNWGGLVANNITGFSSDLTTGSALPGYNNAGGRKVGFQVQVTQLASERHTLSLVAKFENGFPYWLQQNHGNTWQGFLAGRGVDQSFFPNGTISPGGPLAPINGPRIEDWYLPQDPGLPISSTNQCIGPALDNSYNPAAPTLMGCYLYSWMLAHGKWNGKLPTIPTTGFNYNNSDFQQFGIGLRDQWTPNYRLHVDYGLRVDGQNLKWSGSSFNLDKSNTADVGLGYATLPGSYLYPRLTEPRLAASYLVTPSDSVRFGYGRSVSFFFAQTAGTPTDISNIDPILLQIPAKDTATINLDPAKGPLGLGPACGSGWHGPGTNANGTYSQNPYVTFSGASVLNSNGWYFKCPNYASSIYWNFDQAFAAPDIGGQQPATYNNWDLSFMHQFKNGWGMKITGYARRGYDTYQTTLLNAGMPDPVTGQQTAGSFQVRETGIQKAFGIEYMLTTPDRPVGWSGFLTMNYLNELTNTPPVTGTDQLGPVDQFLYQTGTLFHQAYLPPFSARAGIEYLTKSGWRINPIFTFDGGEPFGVGRDAIGFVNGVLYHLPTGNVGVATPYAGPVLPNQSFNATCYVDPAFMGSYFKPRDFACRGYNEPALAGQNLTGARLYTDLDLEYTHRAVTLGVYITNLFDNYRGQPLVNSAWQPLATGVGGVQTGQFANAYKYNLDGTINPLWVAGGRDLSRFDEFWLPFQRLYVPGREVRVYAQFKL